MEKYHIVEGDYLVFLIFFDLYKLFEIYYLRDVLHRIFNV